MRKKLVVSLCAVGLLALSATPSQAMGEWKYVDWGWCDAPCFSVPGYPCPCWKADPIIIR